MNVSRHAIRRIRQRLGIRKKDKAEAIGREAWKNGSLVDKLPEEAAEFVKKNCFKAKAVVYKNFLYIFRGQTLVTLFTLPTDIVKNISVNKKEEHLLRIKEIETNIAFILKNEQCAIDSVGDQNCPRCQSYLKELKFTDGLIQLNCNICNKFISKRLRSIGRCKKSAQRKLKRAMDKKIARLEKELYEEMD